MNGEWKRSPKREMRAFSEETVRSPDALQKGWVASINVHLYFRLFPDPSGRITGSIGQDDLGASQLWLR